MGATSLRLGDRYHVWGPIAVLCGPEIPEGAGKGVCAGTLAFHTRVPTRTKSFGCQGAQVDGR